MQPKLVDTYVHDHKAFTQGLFVHDGYFYESTGLHKQTTLRKVEITTGKVVQQYLFPHPKYFGEGIDLWNGQIVMLTWQEAEIFFFDLKTFEVVRTVPLPPSIRNEGWGLCNNGTHFIFTDGSDHLYFWDPETMTEVGRAQVSVPITSHFSFASLAPLLRSSTIRGIYMINIYMMYTHDAGDTQWKASPEAERAGIC
jgi:glutamine cyclotransferase